MRLTPSRGIKKYYRIKFKNLKNNMTKRRTTTTNIAKNVVRVKNSEKLILKL